MENTLLGLTAKSNLNASSKLGDAAAGTSTDIVLRLDSYGAAVPCLSNMKAKRKFSVLERSKALQDSSSLVLELGCSISSSDSKSSATGCTAISSAKEIEDARDVDLDFHLHLGNKRTLNAKKISHVTPKALEVERPALDLELCLSTGPCESDITCVTPSSTTCQNNLELPVITGPIQLVDEGSTSARWKLREPLPHTVRDTEIGTTIDNVSNHVNCSSNISDHSAIILPVQNVIHVSGPHKQHQRSSSVRTCQVMGCGKGARGASGRCISHGGGRRCQKDGCQKGAEGRTAFCKAHGGGRRCQHLGCTKSAEGRTDCCIAHGGGKRCNYEGCSRAARGKSGLCIRHGGGKRCQMENCTKSAEGLSGLCISHGGGRRCQQLGCTKGAQGSTMFCKAHGGGKRCSAPRCTKGAEGSTPFCKGHGGGKRCTYQGGGVCPKSVHGGTLYCVRHGGGKRCAAPGCTKSARGRTNHCVRHGGGKRCKHDGCGKSAQGSTDFCKAHGGGKRCSWGQLGPELDGQASVPCDKFARGKSGLCAAHSTQIHGAGTISPAVLDPESWTPKKMQGIAIVDKNHADTTRITDCGQNLADKSGTGIAGFGPQLIQMRILAENNSSSGKDSAVQFSLPEGRVHGGSLMAMLTSNYFVGPSSHGQVR